MPTSRDTPVAPFDGSTPVTAGRAAAALSGTMSTKSILVFDPPNASIVRRPSCTRTLTVAVANRVGAPAFPLGTNWSIAVLPSTLSWCDSGSAPTFASPAATVTV